MDNKSFLFYWIWQKAWLEIKKAFDHAYRGKITRKNNNSSLFALEQYHPLAQIRKIIKLLLTE